MLRYLIRYEIARGLMSGPGLLFLGLMALIFFETVSAVIDWSLRHWWLGVIALGVAVIGGRR
jgi:hypothetical protein